MGSSARHGIAAALLALATLAVAVGVPAGPVHAGSAPVLGWSAADLAQVAATEAAIGASPAAIGTFADFTTPFPDAWAQEARRRGVPLVLAWEPWDWSRGRADQPDYSAARIAAGLHDAYARAFARAASASGARILLRYAPEMNGDWNVWSRGPGDAPAAFIRAWHHLRTIFRTAGAANVAWAFNPSVGYDGSTSMRAFWPGATDVDWVALDGYHWSGVLPGFADQSATDVFVPSLRELRALDPTAPFLVAETAAAPADASRWLADMLRTAPVLQARLVLWFEFDKEVDWRLASSVAHTTPSSLPAA